MTEEMSKESLKLKNYIEMPRNGANNFYRHWFVKKFIYTDGVDEYLKRASCYWLLDKLATEGYNALKTQVPDSFYLKISVTESDGVGLNNCVIKIKDYLKNTIYEAKIRTDHPIGKFRFVIAFDGDVVTWCLHAEN